MLILDTVSHLRGWVKQNHEYSQENRPPEPRFDPRTYKYELGIVTSRQRGYGLVYSCNTGL